MNYEMFQNTLAEEVRRQSGGEVTVTLQQLPKNNGVTVEALEIRAAGDLLSPSIYMDCFYEQFLKGVSVTHLAKLVIGQYREFKEQNRFPEDFFTEFGTISENVFCKVINYDKNRELLKNVPCRPWLDLAIVYYYQVEESLIEDATILIRDCHLKRWKISASELEKQAWENSVEKLPPVIQKLSRVLRQWGELEDKDEETLNSNSLYLLTNSRKCLGAACICYPGQAEEIAKILCSDYYVLPSSIHECLILPADGQYSAEELQDMVREINSTQLQPQEVLSDHVYYYDWALHRLSLGTVHED